MQLSTSPAVTTVDPGPVLPPVSVERQVTARHSVLLSMSAGLIGTASYVCALVLAHLLPPEEFGDFAAGQVLLTVVGTVAAALVPLPLAQAVRRHLPGTRERDADMAFAVFVSLLLGCAAALTGGGLALGFAGPAVALAVAGSSLAVCALVPVWGRLQGEGRFPRYAGLTVAEVGVRLGTSAGAVLLGAGAAGALGGFAAGSLAVLALAGGPVRREFRWRPDVLAEPARWGDTGQVALVQLALSVIVAADVLAAAFSREPAVAVAGYQAVSTLAKAPVYVAAGTVLVIFPLLRAGGPGAGEALRSALTSFRRIALLAAVLLATVPSAVAALVLPAIYVPALRALPWLAMAGLGWSTTTVLAVLMLATGRGRRACVGLAGAGGLLVVGLVAGHALDGVHGLAVGTGVAAAGAATGLALLAVPVLPADTARATAADIAVAALGLGVLLAVRPLGPLWLVTAALGGVAVLRLLLRRPAKEAGRTVPRGDATRLEIVHLGFEDPAMPGSGGGSVRTHEIGRRIAASHDLTVLVQRFPGCAERVQDGVRYVHVGVGSGRNRLTRVLGYMLMVPIEVRRRPADVVVEDFFAPVSSMAAPLWTGRPTLAMVQWLNAREKAAQYKVPVHLVERFGVRRHRRAVAVSAGIAERLRAVNPRLVVDVVGNGVSAEAFDAVRDPGDDVVFVGRLEIAHKGLDLLMAAWARACTRVPGTLVVAGTGPDERALRALADKLGVADRVRFAGWVAGAAKFSLLASARVVAVPSRFETFGIVALEAAAAGAPVVAFDIDCLREVVPDACGRRVAPFDVDAYADVLVAAHLDTAFVTDDAPRRAFARGFDWDAAAAAQERVYRDVVRGPGGPP